MYPIEITAPMAAQLNEQGIESLTSPSEVKDKIDGMEGTAVLIVNSVCGCAASNARPGIIESLSGDIKPDAAYTVFAGVDGEATNVAREYMLPYPPSSPSIALFKGGQLVHMLERHHIEGATAQMISDNLKQAYQNYCQ